MGEFWQIIKDMGFPIMIIIGLAYFYINFEDLEIKTTFTKIIKKFL